ncbi:hypothetical protein [Collinsella intestinalis]|uniref:hypothetical protein n=1 Tax=Collinsella intestinalis TaxID=147207 RepID=UPI001958FB40|nr:hypothetical protein [Collinsella intestinalis]MBM6907647.1 hypothetical protein [Collinsella intestinalis]
MASQSKPKVTIDADGVIHVDNGNTKQESTSGTSNGTRSSNKTAGNVSKPKKDTGSAPSAAPSSSTSQSSSNEKPGCGLTGCGLIVGGVIFVLLMCAIGACLAVVLPFITGYPSMILSAIIAAGICYWWVTKS